jgi:nucleoredoxin
VRTAAFYFFVSVGLAVAGLLPLTTSELSLMLRSGYTIPTIEAELTTRHFADELDEAKRKQLLKAGATSELLEAIDSGKFGVPKEDLEKTRRKMEENDRERVLTAEQAKKNDALYQKQLLKQRTRIVKQGPDVIADAAKGNLVHFQNGNIVSVGESDLAEKKIYGLYFSAHWCGPCRKFTPKLVDYYNKIRGEHPEFEIIFVSSDKSADAMATYMREAGMPWTAIEFSKLPNVPTLKKYAGDGIPDLVIVDATGKVLADSYVRGKYVGPERVLDDLNNILVQAASPQVAVNRYKLGADGIKGFLDFSRRLCCQRELSPQTRQRFY